MSLSVTFDNALCIFHQLKYVNKDNFDCQKTNSEVMSFAEESPA